MKKNHIGKKFLFKNFEINESNTKAFNAVQNIISKEEIIYNPLYLSGYNGSGKTHLLKALATETSNLNCKYISMYDFLNSFTENIRSQTMSTFRESYFKLDILCIDNFEYIQDKEATQDEIFNILSYLINSDKIIVVASSNNLDELNIANHLKSLIKYGENIEIKST